MLNPVVSFSIYFLEMLISYLFFSRVSDRKGPPWRILLIGALCFGAASAANLLYANTVWINLISFCLVNLVFGLLCFR